jgi:hypothetical protein
MRLSELYVLQYLVQSTESPRDPLCWQELEGGGYWAEISGVRVELNEDQGVSVGRLYITFSNGPEQVIVTEPRSPGLFSTKYKDEDQRHLAELMRMLSRLITTQCARRRIHSIEHSEELRQEIFHRLVFGTAANGADE